MFDPFAEDLSFSDPRTVEQVQLQRLRDHVRHCIGDSPYYRRALAGRRIDPASLSLADLQSLPVTTKKELAANNEDFLAVPPDMAADVVLTSGTSGEPTRVVYSQGDLRRLGRCEELAMRSAGVSPSDTALLTCTMDRCFVAGLAYYLGLRAIGAAVTRAGQMPVGSVADLMTRTRHSVLVGVPGFLRRLALALRDRGIDASALGVRRMILIGDPLRDASWAPLSVTRDIESFWGAAAYSTYATTETVTACCECAERRGGHVLPQFGIFEILDDKDRPVPPGQQGEVTVTPLGIEAMPLIRFRTGDVSFIDAAPCPCGRTSPRLGPILGRKSQMVKFRGTTLYPPAVFAALGACPWVDEYCLDILRDESGHDHLLLHVSIPGPEHEKPERVRALREALQGRLRVTPDVAVEPADAMRAMVFPAESRKPVRCRDRRGGPGA
jgi:phenylacetate-CoA ligase